MKITREIQLWELALGDLVHRDEGKHYKTSKLDLLIDGFLPHVPLSSTSLARRKSRGKLAFCKEEHE